MKRTWVNVYEKIYERGQYYVSITYATRREALLSVRPSMEGRYIDTINIGLLLKTTL